MEWYAILLLIFGSMILLMLTGIPVAFAFLIVTMVTMMLLWGTNDGIEQLTLSFHHSLGHFILLPIPLFMLMGEVMFHSGIGINMLDALDKWLGSLRGRLSLLTVAGGAVLGTLTGNSMAVTAMMGSLVVPEMEKRGYKKQMTLGPILGSGGLAIMIPPSSFAVFIAIVGMTSVKGVLLGIIAPGLLMTALYGLYIIIRCRINSSIAPTYSVRHSLSEKVKATLYYILPLGFIIFLVTGVIIVGIATPTEAAATGTLGTFLLAAAYRKLTWDVIKKTAKSTVIVSVMIMMIYATAVAMSQILAYTQATKGMVYFALSLPFPPIVVVIIMQFLALILGSFMSGSAVTMITLPIFMPIILAFGYSPVWFIVMFILNMEMAQTTPPVGLSLFAMKGVVGDRYTMGDIYKSVWPFLAADAIVMAIMIAYPQVVLWLPSVAR